MLLLLLALAGATAARAEPLDFSRCTGTDASVGHELTLDFFEKKIDVGGLVTITDPMSKRIAHYAIARTIAPNFADRAYTLEFRDGYSFNFLRLALNLLDPNAPLRLQRIVGFKFLEIPLTCSKEGV